MGGRVRSLIVLAKFYPVSTEQFKSTALRSYFLVSFSTQKPLELFQQPNGSSIININKVFSTAILNVIDCSARFTIMRYLKNINNIFNLVADISLLLNFQVELKWIPRLWLLVGLGSGEFCTEYLHEFIAVEEHSWLYNDNQLQQFYMAKS